MMPAFKPRPHAFFALLRGHHVPMMTRVLLCANFAVFIAMLLSGAGFWHSPNNVQLAWGANFAPATADGEWWRLGSAMFLHFGAVHLTMNMFALWDGGKLVERMYGPLRFLALYGIAGLSGNLLSLVIQGNQAVSGGASGAIFGIYGALISYVWLARRLMAPHEFRWLFWGACAFSALTIVMGFVVPGIDNSAHIGGFISGLCWGVVLLPKATYETGHPDQANMSFGAICWLSSLLWCLAMSSLIMHIPAPKYKWQDELALQKQLQTFMHIDQQASREWAQLLALGQRGTLTYDAWASMIDAQVAAPYAESADLLARLPADPSLPSYPLLARAKSLAQEKRKASKAAAEALRKIPFTVGKPAATESAP